MFQRASGVKVADCRSDAQVVTGARNASPAGAGHLHRLGHLGRSGRSEHREHLRITSRGGRRLHRALGAVRDLRYASGLQRSTSCPR